jgi:hypothetical protein
MKIILSCIILISLLSCSRNPVNKIFDEAKENDQVYAVQVPGWLIRSVLNRAINNETIDSTLVGLESAKSAIKGARVLVAPKVPVTAYNSLNAKAKSLTEKGFESYLSVKKKDVLVNLYGLEKSKKLKDIFFYINTGENGIAMFNLKTDISSSDFEKIVYKINQKSPKNEKKP